MCQALGGLRPEPQCLLIYNVSRWSSGWLCILKKLRVEVEILGKIVKALRIAGFAPTTQTMMENSVYVHVFEQICDKLKLNSRKLLTFLIVQLSFLIKLLKNFLASGESAPEPPIIARVYIFLIFPHSARKK